MTVNTTIPQQSHDRIKTLFVSSEFKRENPCEIVSTNDTTRTVTYAFPSGGTAKQSYGEETFHLNGLEVAFAKDNFVLVDGDGSKAVASLVCIKLDGEFINVVLRYTSGKNYAAAAAVAAGNTRMELEYHNLRWQLQGCSEVTIIYVAVKGVGILSPAFKRKQPRAKIPDLCLAPVTQIRPVRFDAENRRGNCTVDAAKREAVVEWVANDPYERADGENYSLDPNCLFGGILNRPVYPSVGGEAVEDALPVGKIIACWWVKETIYDPTYEAAHSGAKRIT